MIVVVLLASVYAMAAVTISVSAKTVQKSGGGGTITVSGTGAWTAVADSSWITIKSGYWIRNKFRYCKAAINDRKKIMY